MRDFSVPSSFVLLVLVIVVDSCPVHQLQVRSLDDTQNLATDEESIISFQSSSAKDERPSVNMGGYFSLPERLVQQPFQETTQQEVEHTQFRRSTRLEADPEQNEIEIDQRRRRRRESESSGEIVFSLVEDDGNECRSPQCYGWVREQILPMERQPSRFSTDIFDIIDEAPFPPSPLGNLDTEIVQVSNTPIMTSVVMEPGPVIEEREVLDEISIGTLPESDAVLIASETINQDQALPMAIDEVIVEDNIPLNRERRTPTTHSLEDPEPRENMVAVPMKSERRKRSTSTDSKPVDKSQSKHRLIKRPHKKHKRSSPSKHF